MSASIPHPVGSMCPSCGRFVGPLEKCPFCGAQIQKRLPLKFLQLACLVLAILGIVILVYAVSGAPTPTTKIGSIDATMNYGYVRLDGTITGGPIYDASAATLKFYIADDTGELQATTFRDVTRALIAEHKIPSAGDRISVQGTLRIRDDATSLAVASADKLELTSPGVTDRTLHQIGHADEYQFVRVRGDVRAIRQPYQGLTLITLGDAEGGLDLALSDDVTTLYGAPPTFALGDIVQAQGVVTFYQDAPQLTIRHPEDLQKLDIENTAASVSRIGTLDVTRLNQRVKVAGQITRVSHFSQGVRATLADASGELTLLLWQNVYDQLANSGDLQVGAQASVTGKLSAFFGELEIAPTTPDDLQITPALAQNVPTQSDSTPPPETGSAVAVTTAFPTKTPRPTRAPTAAPVVRAISALTTDDKDALVILQGKITRATDFSQGKRFTLDDSTGTISLVIWSDIFQQLSMATDLQEGAELRVIGKIDVFNDALQVVPARAADIELVAAAVIPTVSIRTISSLSTDDLDTTVLIEGTISELEDFSAGKYLTVQDATGTVRVVVFKNVLTPIQSKLAVGRKVSARGKVNVFAGKLEIVAETLSF